jgi:hypothetical protein
MPIVLFFFGNCTLNQADIKQLLAAKELSTTPLFVTGLTASLNTGDLIQESITAISDHEELIEAIKSRILSNG